jgi:iron complex transport system substrate-binding protein
MRVVSMIPCVDAILREVADDSQITAISHYSQDARATSVPLDWARRFPAVGEGAEDVVALAPDLVITGPHVSPQTAAALERLGVRQLRIGVPVSVAESKAQIQAVAKAVGHDERGRALNTRIDVAVMAAHEAQTPDAPAGLIWQDGGLVPGNGTLADDLLINAGFRSASRERGLAAWDMLPLEDMLVNPPDILLTGIGGMATDVTGDAARVARHPALARAGPRIMTADFPSRLLHCGGPVIIDTSQRLVEIRDQWRKRRGS